ncbi:hypothetical protein H9X96_20765 [Pedobacter sp. N36a]|uniref:hypothetical protein n=1 Tax=Pedobacter sp. N36a TaxID=2767996 RepID=UPI001656DB28|nr:hypothetical protein [Pedobacter sp. N36a]MBC8988193.1 hypothetical protein [Pedobacter sp. N36a]
MESLDFNQMDCFEAGKKVAASCSVGIGLAVAGTLALGLAIGGVRFRVGFGLLHAGWGATAMGCLGH